MRSHASEAAMDRRPGRWLGGGETTHDGCGGGARREAALPARAVRWVVCCVVAEAFRGHRPSIDVLSSLSIDERENRLCHQRVAAV